MGRSSHEAPGVEGLIAAEDEFVVGRRPVDLAVFPLDLDEGFGDGLRRLQAVEIGARGDAHVVVGLRIAWLDRESERRRARVGERQDEGVGRLHGFLTVRPLLFGSPFPDGRFGLFVRIAAGGARQQRSDDESRRE